MVKGLIRMFLNAVCSAEFWRMLPGVVVGGVWMVTDPPMPFRKLDLRAKGVTRWNDGSKLAIDCDFRNRYGSRSDCRVGIDLERRRIDWGLTSSWMFNRSHDEGAIGVALLSLPFVVLLWPVLKPIAFFRERRERRRGMSRHGVALLERLRGDAGHASLDAETLDLLETALKNEYAWEKKYRRRVSFAEAQDILKGADLAVHVMPAAEGRSAIFSEELRELVWRDDDGEIVGHAEVVDGELHSMTVLANASWVSDWGPEQWSQLLACHRNRTETVEDPR